MAVANSVGQYNENAGATYHGRDLRREFDKMLMGWDVRVPNAGLATSGIANGGVARYYGAATTGDLAVVQRGAGANMSVDVGAGAAMVGGTEAATQGEYFVFNDATLNVVISASDPSNPRIDVIGIQIRDKEYSGATDDARILVITGTPAGAPVVPTLPADFLSLAHVAVAAAAATIVTGNITDKRRQIVALGGTIPVAGFANLPSVNLWKGMKAFDATNLLEYVYNGSFWVCITPQAALIATSEGTASGAYAALATPGPIVTIQTGTKEIITVGCAFQHNTATALANMGFAISSATTVAAADTASAQCDFANINTVRYRLANSVLITGLTGGSNVNTAQYKTNAGTATFADRNMQGVGVP